MITDEGRARARRAEEAWTAEQAAVERAARVRARMEEDQLRAEVIRVLESQGYTVIPPGGQQ